MDDKKQQFIADFRQWARDYKLLMNRADALEQAWSALYNTLIADEDMPDGILSDGTNQLSSFTTAFGNMTTVTSDYEAGIDTNFERVL